MFLHVERIKGAVIAKKILDFLEAKGIPVEKCVWQAVLCRCSEYAIRKERGCILYISQITTVRSHTLQLA